MLRKQILIFMGMAAAAAFAWWFVFSAPLASTLVTAPRDEPPARLVFALPWLLVPALCLLAGVGTVAAARFFSPSAIDGGRGPGGFIEIAIRYVTNTAEQSLLAAIAWLNLAIYLPRDSMPVIPALAILFGVGRVAFFVGYLAAPPARAFGFALTFYPTAAALIWLASRALP